MNTPNSNAYFRARSTVFSDVIGEESASTLVWKAECGASTEFELGHCAFTEFGFSIMANAATLLKISSLSLEGLGTPNYTKRPGGPRLRTMDRERTFAAVLPLIENLATLRSLVIHGGCMIDDDVTPLIAALARSKVTHLMLKFDVRPPGHITGLETLLSRLDEIKLECVNVHVDTMTPQIVDALVRPTAIRRVELVVSHYVEFQDQLDSLYELVAKTNVISLRLDIRIHYARADTFHTHHACAFFTVAYFQARGVESLEPDWLILQGTRDLRNAVRTMHAQGTIFSRFPAVVIRQVLSFLASYELGLVATEVLVAQDNVRRAEDRLRKAQNELRTVQERL